MPRRATGLTAAKVKSASVGTYTDGGGLILVVQASGAATWMLRYSFGGKRRDMGLGPARGTDAISLADARDIAAEARAQVRKDIDPIEARRAAREAKKAAEAPAPQAMTFAKAAEAYLTAHEAGWRNQKHRAQWRMTLKDYAGPTLGGMAIDKIATADVLAVLKPLWLATPETATRLRGRIENVLDFAAVNGWRDGANPARWRGHLAKLLPARAKVRATRHHPALAWQKLPGFIRDLRGIDAVSARAAEMVILTAARSGEVMGMLWSEVDLEATIWVVPAERMKGKREHRVALSAAAVELLRGMLNLQTTDKPGALVFPGREVGRPLSVMAMAMVLRRMGRVGVTMHGFRSTFRDWCGEATAHPREVVEAALAHRIGNKVEQAYARGDLFAKRRKLMEDWATYCASAAADVVPMQRAG